MKAVYRQYEPDQGLEELQAKIYTEASGLPTSADAIKARYKGEKRDPKTVRYALTEDGNPLAYIQASNYNFRPGMILLSYPWALPECPPAIQEKLYDDLLNYVQQEKRPQEILAEVVLDSKGAKERTQFFRKKGFVEKERLYDYYVEFDVSEVKSWEMAKELASFSSRLATIDDLDHLIDIYKVDPLARDIFRSKEDALEYFKRILQNGHTILIFQENKAVSVGALLKMEPDGYYLKGDEERVLVRSSLTDPDYPQAWKRLLIELAKESSAAGWSSIPLRVSFFFYASSIAAVSLAELKSELECFAVLFTYQSES
ncbi:MAG: hypothetical protein ACFFGZ_10555 [Candidatus Thorarchaeota archaeon]